MKVVREPPKRSKVIIVHNTLWAHYKGAVFSALSEKYNGEGRHELFVIQLTETESNRVSLGKPDRSIHSYNYCVIDERAQRNELSIAVRTIIELKKQRPNVVVVSGFYRATYWICLLYCIFKRIPTIVTIDSTLNDSSQSIPKTFLKYLFCKGVKGAMVYGQRAAEYASFLGVPKSKIFVRCQATANSEIREIWAASQARAIEIRQHYKINKKFNFIFVGRFAEEKNLLFLIECFKELRTRTHAADEWGLILIGSGPLESEIREHLDDSFMRIVPGVPWSEIPKIMAVSDAMILPSISEPWGLVVNEAMVCELPVLVSNRCGCVPDLLDDSLGIVFDPHERDSLISAMKVLIDDFEGRTKMGRNAWNKIQQFTPEVAAENMALCIETIGYLKDFRYVKNA